MENAETVTETETKRVRATFEASRLNAFSFNPADLVLITDPRDPLYDARVLLPLKPEFIANIRAVGILQPALVRKGLDGRAIVVDGRQRVKAALAINEADGQETIKVPCVVRRGDEADAYTATVSANEHRQDDPVREKAAKAQRLAQLGRSEGDIAIAMGCSLATVKKYLDTSVKEHVKKEKKIRTASMRPKTKDLKRLFKNVPGDLRLSARERVLIGFVMGTEDEAILLEMLPELAPEAKED